MKGGGITLQQDDSGQEVRLSRESPSQATSGWRYPQRGKHLQTPCLCSPNPGGGFSHAPAQACLFTSLPFHPSSRLQERLEQPDFECRSVVLPGSGRSPPFPKQRRFRGRAHLRPLDRSLVASKEPFPNLGRALFLTSNWRPGSVRQATRVDLQVAMPRSKKTDCVLLPVSGPQAKGRVSIKKRYTRHMGKRICDHRCP